MKYYITKLEKGSTKSTGEAHITTNNRSTETISSELTTAIKATQSDMNVTLACSSTGK